MEIATKLKDQQSARALAYRTLAEAFRLPGAELSPALQQLESALTQLGSDARADLVRLQKINHTDDTVSLKADYSRLFLGPFLAPAPPYGSVYLEKGRRLMGDSTVDVRNHYLSAGLDISPGFKDAPDHICAELEFMHVLIDEGSKAIDAGDHALLSENIRRQRAFLSSHLCAWLPAFAEKVIEHAQTDFYRHLATLAHTFVIEDLDALPCTEAVEENAAG